MNTNEVKAFFEKTDHYLTFNYNLHIRMETVGSFIGAQHFAEVLDMPCGTGDISAPYIDQFGKLTLMDFSENMIATARTRFAEKDKHKLQFIPGDFYAHNFGESRYNLVLNIGILAHIRDPWTFLEQSMRLVKPGGTYILQSTDSQHWFAGLIFTYLRMRRIAGIDKYTLNKIPEKELLQKVEAGGFELVQRFHYNQSFLGFSRLFSNELKYKLTRRYFGDAERPLRQKTGSDATFIFRKAL
jgi:ubiquinone/menaquinone biosynthesis C-methylase UbiE